MGKKYDRRPVGNTISQIKLQQQKQPSFGEVSHRM